MADGQYALHQGLLQHLKSGTKIKEHFGNPPRICEAWENPEKPYLYFGKHKVKAWSSTTFDGQEHLIEICIISEAKISDAKRLISVLYDRIHDADFQIPGNAMVEINFSHCETEHDAEKGFKSTMVFKALTVSD